MDKTLFARISLIGGGWVDFIVDREKPYNFPEFCMQIKLHGYFLSANNVFVPYASIRDISLMEAAEQRLEVMTRQ